MKRCYLLLVVVCFVAGAVYGTGSDIEEPGERHELSFAWFAGEYPYSGEPVYQQIQEEFNVDIVGIPLSWPERNQQVSLWVLSGDMPDGVFNDGPRSQYLSWVESGVIGEIPMLPDPRFPALSEIWEKLPVAQALYSVEGKLYAWPHMIEANPYGPNMPNSMLYRADWARELGMYKETYTIDEMIDLAIAFGNEDPGNIGAGKVIGFADNHGPSWIIQGYNVYAAEFYERDGEYVWGPRDPSTLEGILAWKRLYDAGGYWRDFYTAQQGDEEPLVASGQVGIHYTNHTLKVDIDMIDRFEQGTGQDFFDSWEFMDVLGADGKRWGETHTGFWGITLFNPNMSEDETLRLLSVMDWIASDAGMASLLLGIQGEDWDMVDGRAVARDWPVDASGNPISPNYGEGDNSLINMSVLSESYDWISPTTPVQLVEMFEEHMTKLGGPNENRNDANLDPFLNTFKGEDYLKYASGLSSEFYDTMRRIIPTTTAGTIEAEYREWLEEVGPQVDVVLAELNAGM